MLPGPEIISSCLTFYEFLHRLQRLHEELSERSSGLLVPADTTRGELEKERGWEEKVKRGKGQRKGQDRRLYH